MKLAYFSHHSLTETSILVSSVLSLLSSGKYTRTLTNAVLFKILSFFSPTGLSYMNSCINLFVMETAIEKRALDNKNKRKVTTTATKLPFDYNCPWISDISLEQKKFWSFISQREEKNMFTIPTANQIFHELKDSSYPTPFVLFKLIFWTKHNIWFELNWYDYATYLKSTRLTSFFCQIYNPNSPPLYNGHYPLSPGVLLCVLSGERKREEPGSEFGRYTSPTSNFMPVDSETNMAASQTVPELGGYDYEFTVTVPDRCECLVCHLPMKDPVQIVGCGHRLCNICMESLLR